MTTDTETSGARVAPNRVQRDPVRALGAFVLALLVVLALREIASLVVPILFGLFLALGASPLLERLVRRGLGRSAALGVVIGVVLAAVTVAVLVIAFSLADLVDLAPAYAERLQSVWSDLRTALAGFGITVGGESIKDIVSSATIADFAKSAVGSVSRASGAILIAALTLVYALSGAASLRQRAESAFGERHALLAGVERFGSDLRRYLVVRAQLGVFAAILVFILLLVLGVRLAALWAFLVFAASFIPNIGTIIALVPPALLALLDAGPASGAAVVVGFTLINLAQDYLLQPRMMGSELNLSSLVVLLSIVAWAWILGAAGALLAVPLTVGLVAILEAEPATAGLALLMRHEIPVPPTMVTPSVDPDPQPA
jgi:predicted PurR-regulated permease PerM